MSRKLTPQPLTAAAFKPYGEVVAAASAIETRTINDGHTTRFHDLASIETGNGKLSVNIFRTTPQATPIVLKSMERHPLSSQTFIPMGDKPFLVVVAPAGDMKPEAITAFLASPDQGVNYFPGTWHHYSLALVEASDFLVIDREGPEDNCHEFFLEEADWIEIELA
jgi:ureidoglycolate lyase